MTVLYTIGYERYTQPAFVEAMQQSGIEHVVDIRRVPQSRKPGFSKSRLQSALADVDIAYSHLVALGTPPELRSQLKEDHDYESFFAQLEAYLATQPAALAQLLELARSQRCALLCLEADPAHCHRSAVARKLVELAGPGLEVRDL